MRRNRPDTTRFAGAHLFDGCRARELAPVAPRADRIRVPAGTVIATAGRSARELMVVLHGVTRVETPAGHVGCMVPGEAIAPEAVAVRAELPVTVTAVTDVELLVVDGPAFRWAVQELPAVARRVPLAPSRPRRDHTALPFDAVRPSRGVADHLTARGPDRGDGRMTTHPTTVPTLPAPTGPPDARYDAIVVGARAAGSATALLLARRGRRVLAVDRATFGSDTLSTHALMRGGVLQLHRWGVLDRIVAAGTPPLRRTVVHTGDDELEIPIKPGGGIDALYAPRRTLLDPVLATAAAESGADVRFGTTVTGLLRQSDGRVTGIRGRDARGTAFQAAAPLVIGADGVRSRVAAAVDAPVTALADHGSACVYAYFGATPADAARIADVGFDGYHWCYRPGATAGVIPTNGGVLVWVGMSPERFQAEVRPDIGPAFWRLLDEVNPAIAAVVRFFVRTSRFHAHPGITGYLRRPWGPGWALVGDASHFKDPLSAHGLTDALRDAELLARAVDVGLERPARMADALAAYEAERDRLSHELFVTVDRVASYEWDLAEVTELLLTQSRCMQEEVRAIQALDGVDALHPAA